jgi:hypothetical protein
MSGVNVTATGALALAGVAAAAFIVWQVSRKGGAASLGQQAGGALVDAADGVASGVVFGIGDRVGVPRTDAQACAAAKARGDLWEASKLCPAGDFLSAIWTRAATGIDAFAIDGPSTTYTAPEPDWSTQGGQWNNPSAYTAPSGQGGAAFGIYPRP